MCCFVHFINNDSTTTKIYTLSLHDALPISQNVYRSVEHDQKTDQTSLGQFSGRVQQTYKHSVPRFFVPEHGTMFTLALVRFPPTATKEIQYLNRSEERRVGKEFRTRWSRYS